MRSFQSLYQLLTLSLWRCRSRRACVRACVHPHARVCRRVCIHMRRRACVRVHVYARAPVYAYMRTRMHAPACTHVCADGGSWWRHLGVSDVVSGARTHLCACACMCTRISMGAYVHACSECYMHFGTGVLGISAWEGLYVTQVCFYTNVHICEHAHCRLCTCVCMYLCVYMDACVYGCVYASMLCLTR